MHSMRRPAQKRKASAALEPVAAGAGVESNATADEPAAGSVGPMRPGRHGRKRSPAELQGTADGLRSGTGKGALAGTSTRVHSMSRCHPWSAVGPINDSRAPFFKGSVQADYRSPFEKLYCRCGQG